MLRFNILAALCLGLLVSCGPARPEGSTSEDSQGQTSSALTAISPTSLNFGDQRVNTTSAPLVVTVRNDGSSPVTVSSVTLSGSSAFTILSPPATPFTLAAGTTKTLTLAFQPTFEGTATGTLTFTTNDPSSSTLTVNLIGRGVKPNLVLDPPSELAFGDVRVGSDVTRMMTVRNTGTGPIVFTSIVKSGPADFTLVNPPAVPFTLPAGAEQGLLVKYSPTTESPAPNTGTLTLTTTDPDWPSVTVNLTGRGVKPNLALNPNPLAFGDVRVGTERTMTVMVSNTGSAPITISAVARSGHTAFTLVSPPASSFMLDPGTTQALTVRYSPVVESATADAGTLTLATTDPDWPSVAVPLTGRGVKPNLVVDPLSLAFGEVRVATTVTKTVTVVNTGTGPITLDSFSTGAGSPFTLVSPPTTPFTLLPGAAPLELTVKYSPTAQGATVGTLTLTTQDPERPSVIVNLTGTGVKPSLMVDPSPLAFGDVRVATTVTQPVRVRNTGSGPITLTSLSTGSGSSSFTLVAPPAMPFTLAAGTEMVLSLKFSPTAEATFTGTLTLTTTDPDWPNVTVNLTGKGVKPSLVVDPNPLAFGGVRVGTTATRTVTVRNTGTGPITVSGITKTGYAAFTLVNPPTTPFTLAAGTEQMLSVQFSPAVVSVTTDSGTLTLTTPDPDYSSVQVAFTGKGVKPILVVDPMPLAFGDVRVGTTVTKTVTVRNTGSGPINLNSFSIGTGSPFTLVTPPATPFTLAANSELVLTVKYSPTAETQSSGILQLTTVDPDYSPNVTVNLTGRGVKPSLVLEPNPLAFGDVRVGTNATRMITVRNTGSGPITIADLATGTNSPFTLISPPAMPFTLAGGDTLALSVRYSPTTQATNTGTVTLSTPDPEFASVTVNLTGRGVKPNLVLDPNPLAFGEVRVGTEATKVVTVSNTGTAPTAIANVFLSGSVAFTLVAPSTSFVLEAGASQVLSVKFAPTAQGATSATLTLNTDNPDSPTVVVPLSGSGMSSPELALSRSSIFFGDVQVGSTSAKASVTVSNTGSANATLSSIFEEGPFTVILPTGSTFPKVIPAGGSFTFDIVFKPTAQGPLSGAVTLMSDTASPLKVALSGNGTVAQVALSVTTLDFGNQRVNDSRALPVIISNTGSADLMISEFIFSHSAFAISSSPLPLQIAPGAQKAVSVVFKPTTQGLMSGKLHILSNAATAAPVLDLRGEGVDGQLSSTPNTVTFSGVDVGSSGMQQSVVLTNIGSYPLTLKSVTQPAETSFTVTGLPSDMLLQPGAQVPFTITFAPVKRGYHSSTLVIETDAQLNPTFQLALSGTGVAPAVELLPRELLFGKSNVGVPVTQDLSIKNVGERDLYVSNVSFAEVSAGAALDFSVGGATVFPLLVKPGESSLVQVKFTPREVGLRQARFIVHTNDKAAEANLVGEGTSPNQELAPSFLDFGNVLMARVSAPRVLTLTNKGNGPLTLHAMTVSGADAAAFLLTHPTLPLILPPASSITVSVAFKPDAERSFSAVFQVESNDPDAPSVAVPLSGSGVRQQIQVSATSLEFGHQLIHHTSRPRQVRLTNNSDTPVTLTEVTVAGTGASQFTPVHLSLPLILAPGEGQDVGAAFTPSSDAEVNSTLKLTVSGLTLEVALHGKGIPAVLSVSPSPLDFGVVRPGAAKREQPLTLTNLSNDPITLALPEVTYQTGEPFLFDGSSLQGRTLEPGTAVIVSVGYQPVVETLSETGLSFGTTVPPAPRAQDVQLKGRAMRRLIFVDPGNLNFGRVDMDAAPVEPKEITLVNQSSQMQRVVVKLKELEGSAFSVEAKALAEPIPPGGSATLKVSFQPQQEGEAQNEVQVWLQGDSEAETLIPVSGVGYSNTPQPAGCSCGSTEVGSSGMLALLMLVGLGSRRRRRA